MIKVKTCSGVCQDNNACRDMMCISKRDFCLLLRLARIREKVRFGIELNGITHKVNAQEIKILRKLRGRGRRR